MSDKRKSATRRSKPVSTNKLKRGGGTDKISNSSVQARSAAARKAAQTRARRATVLKTLKTEEESFSLKE